MNTTTERPILSLSKNKQTSELQTSSPRTEQATPQAEPMGSPPQQEAATKKRRNPPSPLLICFRKHWPTLFDGRHAVPLQIGILKDITRHLAQAGEPYERKQIAKALGIHCRRFAYLIALTKEPYRVGLNGEQTPISDEDRARAMEQLKELIKARQAKENK